MPFGIAGRRTMSVGRAIPVNQRSLNAGSLDRCSIRPTGRRAGVPGAAPGQSAIVSSQPDCAAIVIVARGSAATAPSTVRRDGVTAHGDVELLWGRPRGPWWDVVAGIRHDIGDGPARYWLALGVQGMAPYKFEVEATAYLGPSGRTALRAEAEYDVLLTNRLVLQPSLEVELHGRDDPERGIGSGLSEGELGLRFRYEARREFAPYAGYVWSRKFGRTADFARTGGEHVADRMWVAGIRFWF